jgi:ATP synthase in type III secretion protein N
MTNRPGPLISAFAPRLIEAAKSAQTRPVKGKIVRAVGNLIYATVPDAKLGDVCSLHGAGSEGASYAEIVGFDGAVAMLSPLGFLAGLSTSTEVRTTGRALEIPAGKALLGRVLDGFGVPLDAGERGELPSMPRRPLYSAAPPVLSRTAISKPLPVGVRVIDGLLTCGEGQRIGIYGPPGSGKSLLLAQIIKMAAADVRVIALVGERGREVKEFLEKHLSGEARASSIVIAATSDRSPVERVKAAHAAMSIAEHFRDEGCRVLLAVDSVTRLARALREIGLAAGEPPTRRGFPPSVFSVLPALFERAGTSEKGSITGVFTVLTEGDGVADPVAEETRGLLDGHIVLSAKLAQAGHFPSIDVLASLSRVMMDVAAPAHLTASQKVRLLLSKYSDIEFLLNVGEYKAGTDPLIDEAIAKRPQIAEFSRQPFNEFASFEQTVTLIKSLAL